MSWLTNFEATFQKDEQWVVAEIRKGLAAVQNIEHVAVIDIQNVFAWIQAHQAQLQSLATTALSDIQAAATVASGIVPQYAAPIAAIAAAANTAIQAGALAVNKLAVGIQAGATPMSTIVSAYHTTKDAATAVNNLLKAATKPTA